MTLTNQRFVHVKYLQDLKSNLEKEVKQYTDDALSQFPLDDFDKGYRLALYNTIIDIEQLLEAALAE
jgi:hypothetical protein